MSASEKIIKNVQPHLAPGETVQAAFAGQPQIRFRVGDRYRTVVVTDRRILVFDSGTFSQTKTKTQLAELPRSTRFGRPQGMLWHQIEVAGERLYVNRRYFKQLEAIEPAAK